MTPARSIAESAADDAAIAPGADARGSAQPTPGQAASTPARAASTPARAASTPARAASTSASPRWLDADEQAAWRSFIYSVNTLLGALSEALESDPEIDLALGEYEILVQLSEAEGRTMRMSELADLVVHSRSRLTHTVTRLEKRGLVERVRCAADGRGREAILTDAGLALLERAAPAHVASVRELLMDPIGRADFLELGRIMARIRPGAAADADCESSKAPLVP